MKKLLLLPVFLILLCTTGCMKYSYNIEIDNKDNIKIAEIEAINLSVMESFGDEVTDEMEKSFEKSKKEYENAGYSVENYKDDIYTGLKRTKEYTLSAYHINNLPDGFVSKNEEPVLIKKGFFKNTYSIDLKYDMSRASQKQAKYANEFSDTEEDDSYDDNDTNRIISREKTTDPVTGMVTENITYENGAKATSTYNKNSMENFGNAMGKMFSSAPGVAPVADLTIKIPCKAKEHNAKEVISDNVYKWNLISQTPVEIYITYEKINWLNIILISFFTILMITLFILYRKNMNSSSW